MARAIREMWVRGAPLIGAAAAYGLARAGREEPRALEAPTGKLLAPRPTAVNLRWALERVRARLEPLPPSERAAAAYDEAARICDEDVAVCRAIGANGLPLLERAPRR